MLGVPPASGSQTHLTRKAKFLGVDASHFIGNKWRKGRKFPEKGRSIREYLVKGSSIKSSALRERLIEEGIKERRCELCGLTEWNGKSAPLELDHKNSDHWDNTLDNLQILCPNCHAQVTIERRSTPFGERTDLESVEAQAVAGSTPASGTKFCANCGKETSPRAVKCKSCAIKERGTKIVWPSNDELRQKLRVTSYVALAKELKVSDNAIRKHLLVKSNLPVVQ